MNKYCGIGARTTPDPTMEQLISVAQDLADKGYLLRSGGADGADSAFEYGCDLNAGEKEIFLPWRGFNDNYSEFIKPSVEAYEIASKYHPYWYNLKQGAKNLHARNSHQILGPNLDDPVDFVVCYTNPGGGGTTQALRIAKAYDIQIYNFYAKTYLVEEMIT